MIEKCNNECNKHEQRVETPFSIRVSGVGIGSNPFFSVEKESACAGSFSAEKTGNGCQSAERRGERMFIGLPSQTVLVEGYD